MSSHQRLVEVRARLLGVVALGRAGAEQGAGRGAVLGLPQQLLVRSLLENLDRAEAAGRVLHPGLALLRHGGESVPDGTDWSPEGSVDMLASMIRCRSNL